MSFQIATLEPRSAAVVRSLVTTVEMASAQRRARAILDAARPGKAGADWARLTVWRRAEDRFDYAPGVFVDSGYVAQDPVTILSLPSGRAAQWTLRGGFDELPDAWAQLFATCRAEGLALANLQWEVYGGDGEPAAELYALLA